MSRDPDELIAEIERLAGDGVREITLLGQNVNSYGRDLPAESRISFAELLARVDAVPGVDRIRYTSPHPKDMQGGRDPGARGARRRSASTSTCRCSRAPRPC